MSQAHPVIPPPPRQNNARLSKTRRGGSQKPKNMGNGRNMGVAPLWSTQEFPLLYSARLGSKNQVPLRHHLCGPQCLRPLLVTRPSGCHGRSWPPLDALVGGRGAGDWLASQRPDQDNCEPFLGSLIVWGGDIQRQAHRMGPPLLTDAHHVGSGSGPCPESAVPPGVLTWKERCTYCTCCSPSWLTSNRLPGVSLPSGASCPARSYLLW